MTKLSKNFSVDEFTLSREASKRGIDNSIPKELMPNIQRLVDTVLQPLREHFKKPISITSGYRNPTVNLLAGGVPNSYHTKAQAADIVINGVATYDIVKALVELNIPFDQAINEFNSWVHVQVADPDKTPRGETLQAYSSLDKDSGRKVTKYRKLVVKL